MASKKCVMVSNNKHATSTVLHVVAKCRATLVENLVHELLAHALDVRGGAVVVSAKHAWVTMLLEDMNTGAKIRHDVLQKLMPSLRDLCNSRVDIAASGTIFTQVAQLADHQCRHPSVMIDTVQRMADSSGELQFSILKVVTPHLRNSPVLWTTLHELVRRHGAQLLAAETRVAGGALGMVLCVQNVAKGAFTTSQLDDARTSLLAHLSRVVRSGVMAAASIPPPHQLREWVATLVPTVVDRLDILMRGDAKSALCEPMLLSHINAPMRVKPHRPVRLASVLLPGSTSRREDTHLHTVPSSLKTRAASLDLISTSISTASELPSPSSANSSARNINLPALKHANSIADQSMLSTSPSSIASLKSLSDRFEDQSARLNMTVPAVPTPAGPTPVRGVAPMVGAPNSSHHFGKVRSMSAHAQSGGGLLAKLQSMLLAKAASWLHGIGSHEHGNHDGISRADESRRSASPTHCWKHMPWAKRGEKPCMDDFELLTKLSTGATSKVYAARVRDAEHLAPGKDDIVALKVMKKRRLEEMHLDHVSLQERAILEHIQGSRFIVRLFGWFQDERLIVLVTEYATGDFFELMTEHFGTAAYRKSSRLYAAEVLLGLEWMHQRGVMYCDLKPENLLVRADGHLMLADLGLSTRMRNGERASRLGGTSVYMSPERLAREDYGFMSDLWSYGVLLHEMLTGHTPFDGEEYCPSDMKDDEPATSNDIMIDVRRVIASHHKLTSYGELNDIRLNDSVYINKAAKALITSLLCVDETMRLGYNDEVGHYHSIKQHPWFASINWDNVNAALYRPAIISPSLPSRREPG